MIAATRHTIAIVGGAAALLLLGGCAGSEPAQPTETPARSKTIEFWEAVATPVHIENGRARAGVMSARIVNTGESTVTVETIEPVTEPGLRAEYLGYSTCVRGCAGSLEWDREAAERVRNGLEGRLPIELVPKEELEASRERPFSLTFRLSARGRAGVAELARRCLRLRALEVVLDDGSRFVVSTPGGNYVGAIKLVEPQPRGYGQCGPG